MSRSSARVFFPLVFASLFISVSLVAFGQNAQKPLRASQVMALQAGGGLPENVAHDIELRGLSFLPDDNFLGLMKKAGADTKVLAALSKAKTTVFDKVTLDRQLLVPLSEAAVLMKNQQYAEAGTKLNEVLGRSSAEMETSFVMAELMRRVERYDKAAELYGKILQQESDFPEVHDKASFVLYALGDSEDALNEARAALKENPEDAEAHKNAGLALDEANRFEAAEAEYKEALRIKPDYASTHNNLALLLTHMHAYDDAIAEYKKAIVMDPGFALAHYNLGNAYRQKGGVASAIREFREAKRLDPNKPSFRQNLASALMTQDVQAAVVELRELEQKFPDFEMCHVCLGNALVGGRDLEAAEAEYRLALKLVPADPDALSGLGRVKKEQKDYDAALEIYKAAEKIAPDSAGLFQAAGELLLEKKDYAGALEELKKAVQLEPQSLQVHEAYGRALKASGDTEQAITELKEAVGLDPKQGQVMTELGSVLEEKGDWVGALEQYRKGALVDSERMSKKLPGEAFTVYGNNPLAEYAAAQKRFEGYVAQLKASGEGDQAAELEKSVGIREASASTLEKEQAAMQAGGEAMRNGQAEQAEQAFKEAVQWAEQLPPGDDTLAVSLDKLGQAYGMRGDMTNAEATLHRELTEIEKTLGPMSPRMTQPLTYLGIVAAKNQNYVLAEKYMSRSVEINVRVFGEKSLRAANSLQTLAQLYKVQKQWEKAEAYYLRSVKALELDGEPDDPSLLMPLWQLCDVYEHWGNTEKAEQCWDRATEITDRQFGKNSESLAKSFAAEAEALRHDGKIKEAEMLEQRIANIQAAVQH